MMTGDLSHQNLKALIADLKAQMTSANAEQRKCLKLRLKACKILLKLEGRNLDGRKKRTA